MKLPQSPLLGSVALIALAPAIRAHFRLLEPTAWPEESQVGDPQKKALCGGTFAEPGKGRLEAPWPFCSISREKMRVRL
jgi:hypothetical protein